MPLEGFNKGLTDALGRHIMNELTGFPVRIYSSPQCMDATNTEPELHLRVASKSISLLPVLNTFPKRTITYLRINS